MCAQKCAWTNALMCVSETIVVEDLFSYSTASLLYEQCISTV